jgi:hypothetical protein
MRARPTTPSGAKIMMSTKASPSTLGQRAV